MGKFRNISKVNLAKNFGALIGTACFFLLQFNLAQAQTSNWDFPSVQVVKGELISPTAAFVYYQQNGGLTYPTGTQEYRPRNDSRLIELAQTLGYDSSAWAAMNASDLAKAKNNYVDAAYLYVRNGVEFTPMFGLQHGAMGAMYHGSGTAFDQAHLLVELMKVANFTATYQIGEVTPSAAEFYNWFGTNIPKTACEILANGGIPATVNSQNSCDAFSNYNQDTSIDVTISHIWVRINVNGTYYLFDPAFKQYQIFENKMFGPEFDLFEKSGITRADLIASVGGNHSGMTYNGPDPKGLREYLNQKSDSLLTALNAEDDIVSSLYALGGRRLSVTNNAPRLAALPNHTANISGSAPSIPNELTAFVDIDLAMGVSYPSYEDSVHLPLSRIGVDSVVVSPIKLTDGGHFSDGSSVFTADNSRFELSLIRPGSTEYTIHSNTGSTGGRHNPVNETSGENLLDIVMSLEDVTNRDWQIQLIYNAPFAMDNGNYGDRVSAKPADRFTSTTLIIQVGAIKNSASSLYERFIPQKTNIWFGLYKDNHYQVSQCDEQRHANLDSMLGGGGGVEYTVVDASIGYAQAVGNCGGNEFAALAGGACLDFHDRCYAPMDDVLNNTTGSFTLCVGGQTGYNPVTLGSFGGGGGIVVPETACFPTPEEASIKFVSHDKKIRLKSIIAAQWHKNATGLSELYARSAKGRGLHALSLGIVSAGIVTNQDLSIANDALLIDVDTTILYSSEENAKSIYSYAVATAAGLSALEGTMLQVQTGAPRVDSAVTKNDWYAWNAGYNSISGIHAGPYGRDYDPAQSLSTGSAVFEGFSPSDSLASVEALAGPGAEFIRSLTQSGFTYIRPGNSSLGPVEYYQQVGPPLNGENYSYPGRGGRKHTSSGYKTTNNRAAIIHLVGAGKKGGTGVTLPEFKSGDFDEEALTKESFKKAYGEFSVDDKSGDFSFELENGLVVGGAEQNKLTFSRTYESVKTGNGPLGQGWSHNHDAKIVVSTDLGIAFDGRSPVQSIPALIAAMATMEMAEGALESGDWTVLTKSLLIHAWLAEEIFDNQITVTASTGSDTFYKAPNNQYVNVENPSAILSRSGRPKFFEAVKPYIPAITKQDLIELGATDPQAAQHNPLYPRRYWVIYEQHLDYSDVDFFYTTAGKTIMEFPRGDSLATDNLPLSCFPDSLRPYRNGASLQFCGKENGSWHIKQSTDAMGRILKYCYSSQVDDPDCETNSGFSLTRIIDVLYGYELNFEYETHIGGIVFNLEISLDENPGDPLWQLSQSNFMPDSALTHGQLSRLKSVSTNVDGGPVLTFNYNPSTDLNSPILTSVTDASGAIFNYSYVPLAADLNTERDKTNLLNMLTSDFLGTPIFELDYSPTGRATSLTDGDGRTTKYGVNGIHNSVVDPIGNETIRLYDPDGRLIEQIEPSYEGDAP